MKPQELTETTETDIDNAVAIEGSKLTALALLCATGAVNAPILAPVAGLCVLQYALTVGADWFLTGRLAPFPISRATLGDLLDLAGSVVGSEKPTPKHDLTECDWTDLYRSRKGLELPRVRVPMTLEVRNVEPRGLGTRVIEPQVIEARTVDVPIVSLPARVSMTTPRAQSVTQPSPVMQPSPVTSTERRGVPRPMPSLDLWEHDQPALPVDRGSLLEALKRDCPEFVRLLKAPPIRCVGQQRTGKTTLVKLLCLCRTIILVNHQVIAATPHYKEGEGYPACFKIAGIRGTQRDPVAIAREWNAMAQRINKCGTPGRSFTNVWDEFGLYDSCVEPDDLLRVVTSSIRETTKFGEYPIFIVHGETAAFLPGVKGLIAPFLQGTTRVETIGAPTCDDEGIPTVKPTGRFRINWTDGSNSTGQIPEWLTENLLLSIVSKVSDRPSEQAPAVDPWAEDLPYEPAIATPSVPVLPLNSAVFDS